MTGPGAHDEDGDDELPELLSSSDMARIFRVARSTVVGWARRGLLPYTRTPSGRLRFYRSDVQRLLKREHRETD